jgi:hypothetical protein
MNAILLSDINGDGRKDIIAGGNMYGFQPQFSRIDASYGTVLINKGNRNWEDKSLQLHITGEVRSIIQLRNDYLFLRNNDFPVLYSRKVK